MFVAIYEKINKRRGTVSEKKSFLIGTPEQIL
jgi:hypothetical protein